MQGVKALHQQTWLLVVIVDALPHMFLMIQGGATTTNKWAIRLQLTKPVTWVPLIWGVACGAAASGKYHGILFSLSFSRNFLGHPLHLAPWRNLLLRISKRDILSWNSIFISR